MQGRLEPVIMEADTTREMGVLVSCMTQGLDATAQGDEHSTPGSYLTSAWASIGRFDCESELIAYPGRSKHGYSLSDSELTFP